MKMCKHALSNLELYLFIFFSSAIIGFIWEILYTYLLEQVWYKRGFFYGPWLPIYGSGAIVIYFFLHKKNKQPVFCFFSSGILCSLIELCTGWFQHTVYGLRYWDYSDRFMNLGGYICLLSFPFV